MLCKNTNCTKHCDDIDSFYAAIISALLSANRCIPSTTVSNKGYIVPGWNEYVKEHHLHAKDAPKWWNLNNRPRYEPIYDSMRTSKTHFKYALRFAKNQEETAKADVLARDLFDKDVDEFGKRVVIYRQMSLMVLRDQIILQIIGDNTFRKY